MNRKGFIFVETIVVMMIVMISLTLLLGTFVIITSISKGREYYDRINDLYLLDNFIHYETLAIPLKDRDPVQLTSANCHTFMASNCADVMEIYDIDRLIIIESVGDVLRSQSVLSEYSNKTIEYLKTLDKTLGMKYIIGVFEREEEQYFASLRVD